MKKISILILITFALITSCSQKSNSSESNAKDSEKATAQVAKEDTTQVAKISQEEARKKYEMEIKRAMDEEFKNPKQPVLKDSYNYKGAKDAPVTIVTYSDFQCSFCSRGHLVVQDLLKKYSGKVRFTFKNLPLESMHPYAMISAKYYEAIILQNKELAWKFHDTVFENQQYLYETGESYLKSVAKNIGVDLTKLEKDIKSDAVGNKIKEDMKEAEKMGFRGTPAFLVNGVSVVGAQPIDVFSQVIDRHLQKNK